MLCLDLCETYSCNESPNDPRWAFSLKRIGAISGFFDRRFALFSHSQRVSISGMCGWYGYPRGSLLCIALDYWSFVFWEYQLGLGSFTLPRWPATGFSEPLSGPIKAVSWRVSIGRCRTLSSRALRPGKIRYRKHA